MVSSPPPASASVGTSGSSGERRGELIENGEAELRQWIVLLGAVGAARPEFLVYEPLYRSIMGMGVGWWSLS